MKKLLSIFAAVGLTATSSGLATTVVSCTGSLNDENTYISYYNENKDKNKEELETIFADLKEKHKKASDKILETLTKDQISEVNKIYISMSKALEDKSTIEDISKIFAEYLPQIEKLIGSDFVNSLYKLNIITIILSA